MSVIDKLASSLGNKGEDDNIALAQQIATANDAAGIKELIANLTNKDKGIQSDCIKTLYEIAEIKPAMVAAYADTFIALLDNKNNRLQWGAMTALDSITLEKPALIFKALPKIIEVADKGSVITKDHCMGILIKLYTLDKYTNDAFDLFIGQLRTALTNQLPKYAEDILPHIRSQHRKQLAETLSTRLNDIEKDTKKARVEKAIKKLSK